MIRANQPETILLEDQFRAALSNLLDVPIHGVPVFPKRNMIGKANTWLEAFHVEPLIFHTTLPDSTCIVITDEGVYITIDKEVLWTGTGIGIIHGKIQSIFELNFCMYDRTPRSLHVSILEFCKIVRDSFAHAEFVYTKGSCYKFHEILKTKFDAEPYTNIDHIISKVGNRFYDITGEVDGSSYLPLRVEKAQLEFYQGNNKADIADPWFIERLLRNLSPSEKKRWLNNYPKVSIDRIEKHMVNIIK